MSKAPLVYVVGSNFSVQKMFQERGFTTLLTNMYRNPATKPDLICFTGGEDVSPGHYGEIKITERNVHTHPLRDAQEIKMYETFVNTPKVGICRGGQLLNVLSGGALWQHVSGHAGDHEITDLLFDQKIKVTSTHHQMMVPDKKGMVLAFAKNLGSEFTSGNSLATGKKVVRPIPDYEPEVVWYPHTLSLCYQPHPEYSFSRPGYGHTNYFFNLLNWAYDFPLKKD